jgi:O-antigen ligase
LLLWDVSPELIVDRPLGYGVGDGYQMYLAAAIGESDTLSVHNGYITTILEVGIPLSVILFLSLLVALWRVVQSLQAGDRLLAPVALGVFAVYLSRATIENYLFFNSANFVTVLFLWLYAYYLVNTPAERRPAQTPAPFSSQPTPLGGGR